MKNRIIQLLMILLLFCFALTTSISNAQYSLAVKSGDWMRYDITATYLGQSVRGSVRLTVESV